MKTLNFSRFLAFLTANLLTLPYIGFASDSISVRCLSIAQKLATTAGEKSGICTGKEAKLSQTQKNQDGTSFLTFSMKCKGEQNIKYSCHREAPCKCMRIEYL